MKGLTIKLVLTLLASNLWLPSITFAKKNPEPWRRESLEHKERLIEFSQYLRPYLPSLQLYWHYFIGYMELHDIPKVMSTSELKNIDPQYKHNKSIYARMSRFYGLNQEDMDFQQLQDFRATRDDLNRIENLIKTKYKNEIPESVPDFSKIELVLDFIDTTIFRGEELHISPSEYSYYLAEQRFYERDMPEHAELSRELLDILKPLIEKKLQTRTKLKKVLNSIHSSSLNSICQQMLLPPEAPLY